MDLPKGRITQIPILITASLIAALLLISWITSTPANHRPLLKETNLRTPLYLRPQLRFRQPLPAFNLHFVSAPPFACVPSMM